MDMLDGAPGTGTGRDVGAGMLGGGLGRRRRWYENRRVLEDLER